jgi:hypothetical protein
MAVPAACQQWADQATNLDQQYTALATKVGGETGAPAWQDLAALGNLRSQLLDVESSLAQCVATNSAALQGVVVLIDATGDAAAGTQTATLWDLTGDAPVAGAQASVAGGAFGLAGPVPPKSALTLQTTGAAGSNLNGYDFRSGLLETPLAQPLRCEMVICPQLLVPASALQDWASSFVPVTQSFPVPAFQTVAMLTISSVTVALSTGSITINATGVISVTGLPSTPFSASLPLAVAPSGTPLADEIATLSVVGSGATLQFAGGPGDIISGLLNLFSGSIANQLPSSLHAWAQQSLPGLVATALALPDLPAGTTVTLRSVSVDSSGITIQPVLGAVGTGLSTYQPQPLPVPAEPA